MMSKTHAVTWKSESGDEGIFFEDDRVTTKEGLYKAFKRYCYIDDLKDEHTGEFLPFDEIYLTFHIYEIETGEEVYL